MRRRWSRDASPRATAGLKAEFRLWDVFADQHSMVSIYHTYTENWRRIAHIISDAIYERLTGEKGYFDSRVVFVDESGPKARRTKRLALMDQDGANVRYLTRGDDLVLTPRFSSTADTITYMSYGQGDPRVYLMNIETGQREIVGNFPGMSFSPRFSPRRPARDLQPTARRQFQSVRDGLAREGDDAPDGHASDRYRAFLFARRHPHHVRVRSRRTAADLRDGGERRPGATHQLRRWGLFDASMVAARRLHRFYQASAGKVLDRYHATGWFRRADLTEGYHNEGPTWSPNGRVIMLFRDPGGDAGPMLFTVDVTGATSNR